VRCSLTASLDVPEAAIASATRELEVFAAMNRGPGFVDWPDVDPRGRVEIMAAMLLGQNGGCTSYAQARLAAMRFHDRLAEIVEEGRRAAELGDRRRSTGKRSFIRPMRRGGPPRNRCGGYRLRVPQNGGPSPDAGERTMSGMPSTQYAFPPVLYDKSRP
jgi:hypothetical protein